jgi:hypothetical protein
MKLYNYIPYILYGALLFMVTIYSYVLVDPNLTLLNTAIWESVREWFVAFGYFQRESSSLVFLFLLLFLSLFHWYFLRLPTVSVPILVAGMGFVALISYPLLSHDFFNYLFDAKILVHYHENPYFFKPTDFASDPWLRFMHWTHRTYPYGPVFLIISAIPAFLGFGKFLLYFLLFKVTFYLFYCAATYALYKRNKIWAVLFATHPFVIIEGLVNAHNDMIAVCIAIIGICFLIEKKSLWGRITLLLSAGIKYLTLPLIFIGRKRNNMVTIISFVVYTLFMVYLGLHYEIQAWYFLGYFAFVPLYSSLIMHAFPFFIGLILSYYPYVRYGAWDSDEQLIMKHQIIVAALFINAIYVVIRAFRSRTWSFLLSEPLSAEERI